MVQRKAARFVFNDFSSYSSVSSMLTKLNWQSWEQRRTNAGYYHYALQNYKQPDLN